MSLRRQVNELSTKFCQELENLKEKTIQETKKQLMEERQLLEEEKQQWEKEKQLMKTLNPKTNDIVYLNVGGRHFTTSITTLTTFRNSFFTTMFSGRFELSKTKDDCIFIDRDGDPFVYILEYLRDREIILPNKDVEVLKKKITILVCIVPLYLFGYQMTIVIGRNYQLIVRQTIFIQLKRNG